ncbi:sucrose transport protein SUT4-like [Triticum dicoccoides]|uniref:sucrose transport protein SUT4-like n=1 Tax=Triticum dicoccoides TaxID=85692 RepID=UPI00188FA280|nr:sucrose transport protein SUT4-like [Triticum dicoccoides]
MDSGRGGRATAIRMSYHHIRDAEMELVRLNSTSSGGDADRPKEEQGSGRKGAPKYRVVLVCMVAAGVQFGWVMQLSLLTPYIQISNKQYHYDGCGICRTGGMDDFFHCELVALILYLSMDRYIRPAAFALIDRCRQLFL